MSNSFLRCAHPARRVLCLLILLVLVPTTPQAGSIAVIKSTNLPAFDKVLKSFLSSASDQGLDLDILEFNLKAKMKNGKGIAEKIQKSPPLLVLAMGPLAAQMAKEKLADLPVLYCMVSNPRRYGLSGDNIAGISLDVPGEIQFALYKTIVPTLKTVGVIYDPLKSGQLVEEAKGAAAKLGLKLLTVSVNSHKKVPGALRGMLGKIDALWMLPDDTVLTTDSFRFLLVTSFENKLPFLAISDIFVKVGALATIAPDPEELGRQISRLVGEIQSGTLDLGRIDILPPSDSNLVINVKTAQKIGLELTPEVLQSASKLYQ
jgi:putative ABC transport system substrate-binding protein